MADTNTSSNVSPQNNFGVDLKALGLKWWQYLVIAVVVIGVDITTHISKFGFGVATSSEFNLICIPIASAALVAMCVAPAVKVTHVAATTNLAAISDIAATVTKIDEQTDGVLDTKIHDGATTAILSVIQDPVFRQVVGSAFKTSIASTATTVPVTESLTPGV